MSGGFEFVSGEEDYEEEQKEGEKSGEGDDAQSVFC